MVVVVTKSLGERFGCRSTAPALYAVEGRVLVNGQPARDVNVAFHPRGERGIKLCPVGRTDSKGVFRLSSRVSEDGAPAGEYSVTFIWPDTSLEIDECECPNPLLHDRFNGMYAATDTAERVVVGANNSYTFGLWQPR